MSGQKCRFCNNPLEHVFVDLGVSPVSNDFLTKDALSKMEPMYPLSVYVCEKCFLVQLPAYQSADSLFRDDYVYFSSFSKSWVQHASDYVDMMCERFGYSNDSQVVELASNDGYLLQHFKAKGVPVLGVEPCANVAAAAEKEKGVPSVVKFFGVQTAKELLADGKSADLLLGNNVLAHVPDINDFVGGMKLLLKSDGVITMEFPHLMKLMDLNQFDTIYHEHYSYLSFSAVERIFSHHGLTLFDVEELGTHGGSLRIFARHTEDQSKPVTDRAIEMLNREDKAGYNSLEYYQSYQAQVEKTKRNLLTFLIEAKEQGKAVVGYGAPAKGNTLLNYCGIRTDFIDYTTDLSPHKQGLYLPGVHIPIYAPEKIMETKPDYVLILPWNLKNEIIEQMKEVRSWGGKFVTPIPVVEIHD